MHDSRRAVMGPRGRDGDLVAAFCGSSTFSACRPRPRADSRAAFLRNVSHLSNAPERFQAVEKRRDKPFRV